MNTLRLTIAAFVAALVALFAPHAEGQTGNIVIIPTNTLAYGSSQIVADHTAQVTDQFWLDVYQVWTNGYRVYYGQPRLLNQSFTKMSDMNALLVQLAEQYSTNIFTTTNAHLNEKFIIFATAEDIKDYYTVASCYHEFSLVMSNGQYRVPDLSSLSMEVAQTIPYEYSNIDWAVMQVYDLQSNLVDVLDSRLDPSSGIADVPDQVLALPSAYITGQNLLRMVVVSDDTHSYKVYGARGAQIPAIMSTMQYSTNLVVDAEGRTNQVMNIRVNFGDVGQNLYLWRSSDLLHWTNLMAHQTYYSGFDIPGYFSYSETNDLKSNGFFEFKDIVTPY
ncbi:MAG: hypothetical protein KGI69_02370 [Patescibacteria group bacterium]|nr:hypothetical protein [Patescibacteria group bacterium]